LEHKVTLDGSTVKSGTFYGYHPNTFLQMLDKPLAKGDRVELIPVKDGVKVIRIKREEIK
jgi:hypothetical protein